MLLVMLKNVLCIVADGLSKNVDFFIVRKKHFHHEEKVFSSWRKSIFTVKKKYFHREEKVFSSRWKNSLLGRGSAFQYADDGEQRKADRSQSGQYPCGNGIITMLGRHLEKESGEEKAE